MPASITVISRVPIPSTLDPSTVIQAMHTFEPLITANPFVVRHERRPVPVEDLVDDPFFRDDGQNLRAFVVHDRVPIIPGVAWASKHVSVPCVFQSFGYGVRCRADAQAGVTVRSSYEVRRRGEVEGGPEPGSGGGGGDVVPGEFELVEIAKIECGSLVKSFVKRNFATAHEEILQRFVDELLQAQRGGSGGGVGGLPQQQQQQQHQGMYGMAEPPHHGGP